MMSVDIPDEAYEAMAVAAKNLHPESIERLLRAVAPHIARSAQVAILRELSEDLLAQRDCLRSGTDRYRNASRQYGLEEAAQMARSKANALEAGAGQAEVRDED